MYILQEKYQPNIIPELQTELSNAELSIVDKHKNIRRLFAKALKGCEKKKLEDIPIFDFEENNCEYADISKVKRFEIFIQLQFQALIEDGDLPNSSESSAPIEQRNVIEISNATDNDGEQHRLLDLSVIRFYGDKQDENLTVTQLIQY